jgi:hypothetical protein
MFVYKSEVAKRSKIVQNQGSESKTSESLESRVIRRSETEVEMKEIPKLKSEKW